MRIFWAAFLMVAPTLSGQSGTQWIPVQSAANPVGRAEHAMAFDSARGEVVMFGGFNGAYMDDTWILDGTGWQRRVVAGPSPRASHALAYDPVRERVVLMGGSDGQPKSDIWEWDGSTWTMVASNVPGISADGAACYDPTQGGVFYNLDKVNLLWDGQTVFTHVVANPEGGVLDHQMVFDPASGGPLTFFYQSTRVFNPLTGWQELNSTNYIGRTEYAMAYDPGVQRPVLHGGDGHAGASNGDWHRDTWEWTGTIWTLVANGPPEGRNRHAMVFDENRGAVVMFGGTQYTVPYADTTLQLVRPQTSATYEAFGAGCSGTGLTPSLAPDPLWNSRPVVGGILLLRAGSLPPGEVAFGFLGFSDQSWLGQSLPLPLDTLGMPGCSLLVTPEFAIPLARPSSSGVSSWLISIPQDQTLIGLEFFQQVAVVAPGANPAGVLWSNGGRGKIGTR